MACTPNGAVLPLYVGSISVVELTRFSGFVEQLQGKSDASIMAGRGFTVKDQLVAVGVTLNIPTSWRDVHVSSYLPTMSLEATR